MDKDTRKALKKVFVELMKMPQKEFDAELEKHKDGDIANALLGLWKFNCGTYQEGYNAFYDNKNPDDNPYSGNDPKHEDWEAGYIDADIRESGEIS